MELFPSVSRLTQFDTRCYLIGSKSIVVERIQRSLYPVYFLTWQLSNNFFLRFTFFSFLPNRLIPQWKESIGMGTVEAII